MSACERTEWDSGNLKYLTTTDDREYCGSNGDPYVQLSATRVNRIGRRSGGLSRVVVS